MQRIGQIDLHIHSTASDGVLTPSEVISQALQLGLEAVALTDHDTVAGVAEAVAAATRTGPEVVPGVEISSEGSWGDLHFLGYYVDVENRALLECLQAMLGARLTRAEQMVERLAGLGMPLDWDEVRGLAAGESVGRPHVARALLGRGYVTSTGEAFDRYIGRDGPAYVPRLRLTPAEVIELIRQAGGVPVLAHPAGSGALGAVPEFASLGLRGLEVYYPSHSPEQVQALLGLCQRHRLLVTGGSDFHSPEHAEGAPMGSVLVPDDCVARLKEEAARGGLTADGRRI